MDAVPYLALGSALGALALAACSWAGGWAGEAGDGRVVWVLAGMRYGA